MGWNIRKRKEILPGVHANLSKKGLGLSVGPEHSTLSVSPGRRVTENIGIPGTGIRYTNVVNTKKSKDGRSNSKADPNEGRMAGQAPIQETLEESRFNREPIDLQEWQKTRDEVADLVKLLKQVKLGKDDNSVAPDFPTNPKEVVFVKAGAGLTDLNATPHKDAGFVYLTNQRVLFMGLKSNIEWSMKTMVTPMPLEQQNIIGFQCTDHSGIGAVVIVPNDWYKFYFYTLMVFGAQKKLAEVLSGAESQLKQYAAVKPA